MTTKQTPDDGRDHGRDDDRDDDEPGGDDEREAELEEVEDLGAPRPIVVYEVIRREGESELERPPSGLAWSGLAAGLSLGFSFVTQALLQARLPDAAWRPLVVKFGYSIGFLIVVLGRQQLFTENTLTPILPLFAEPSRERFRRVMRLWAIVLVTNLIGTFLFALAASHTDAFEDSTRTAMLDLTREALHGSFGHVFLVAIFAGWLIALMVWLLPAAETARPTIIILLTYVIGIAGFAHVIAGSAEVFYAALVGDATWGHVLGGWLVPALLGNVLGGVSLVAALNHAQVVGQTVGGKSGGKSRGKSDD